MGALIRLVNGLAGFVASTLCPGAAADNPLEPSGDRLTEDGDTRITEDSDNRIVET